MFDFLKKKLPAQTTLCVCTVTSYSVTAAVVRTYHHKDAVTKPVVLFSCEEKISLRHERDNDALETMVMTHMKWALEQCRGFHGNFDELVCTIGEPWVTTFSRTAHLEKNQFRITKSVVADMISRDIKIFEQETMRDFVGAENIAIVGTSQPIFDVNGYRSGAMIGEVVKTLDMHVAYSIAPVQFIEDLRGVFGDVFHRHDVRFQSIDIARPLLVSRSAKACIVDIGGVTSTVSIIDRGTISYTASLPVGLSDIERGLEIIFQVPRSQISAVMQFATDEKMLQHQRDVYYKRIESAYRDFGVVVRRGMLHLKKFISLIPQPMYVTASPVWTEALVPLLEKDLDGIVVMPNPEILDNRITYTYGAPAQSVMLSSAILQALEKK